MLTPCCQLGAPKMTMSTNFKHPRSAISVGSSTTCRQCASASGTSFAVVQGRYCCFRAEVAMAEENRENKKLLQFKKY